MTIKRLLVLQVLLIAGFGALALVPRSPAIQPASVNMQLPENIGMWSGKSEDVTQRERDVLAKDTAFERKIYSNGFGDSIWVSIVLSGHDLDNSIHRPERCLPAQGWTIVHAQSAALPVKQAPNERLKVMRLYNSRPVEAQNGEVVAIHNLNYYWFVGGSELTASHLSRTFIDIRDRLLYGQNQRWAYITIAANVTEGLVKFGRSEQETDAMLQEFIARVYPAIISTQSIGMNSIAAAKTQTPGGVP